MLFDRNVDAPDLHLILKSQILEAHIFEGNWVASIDRDLCTNCGICTEYCRFEAITVDEKDNLSIDPYKCEGCRLCERICPSKAIHSARSTNNYWYVSRTRAGLMTHASMGPGEENSGKLVSQVRKRAKEIGLEKGVDVILTDGPPGTGCAVISSIAGTDAVLMVIESSTSSLHDAKRVIELAEKFRIPLFAILNKFEINGRITTQIERFLKAQSIPLLGKIPFDESVVQAMVSGYSYPEYAPHSATTAILRSV